MCGLHFRNFKNMQPILSELVQSFNEKLELGIPEDVSEADILLKLEERLGQLIQRDPEDFFRIMYRVDIPEYQLNNALQQADALQLLARMVYNRQLGKIKSRREFKAQQPNEVDKDLEW